MGRYLIRRLLLSLVALWAIATITFILMQTIPGEPFLDPKIPEYVRLRLMELYGLDKPLWQQYLTWLNNLVHWDFGISFLRARPVNNIIADGTPNSAILGLEAIAFSTVLGLALGIVAALNRNRGWDYTSMVIAILGVSVPNFVLAALLQYYVGVKLNWLPVAGWRGWEFHIMPAFALGVQFLAIMARMMRTQMLDVIGQDYIRTARAKGLSNGEIIWRHEIRNAILPIITILGPLVAALVTGTFIIEVMFNIPGLGRYFVNSISARDYPVIMGTTVFYSVILVAMNFLVDMAYGLIDPRIRLSGGRE